MFTACFSAFPATEEAALDLPPVLQWLAGDVVTINGAWRRDRNMGRPDMQNKANASLKQQFK